MLADQIANIFCHPGQLGFFQILTALLDASDNCPRCSPQGTALRSSLTELLAEFLDTVASTRDGFVDASAGLTYRLPGQLADTQGGMPGHLPRRGGRRLSAFRSLVPLGLTAMQIV